MAKPTAEHPLMRLHRNLPAPLVGRMKAFAKRRNLSMYKAVEALLSDALTDAIADGQSNSEEAAYAN
jgi:hypothetical protein